MKFILNLILVLLLIGCVAPKSTPSATIPLSISRTKPVESLDANTYLLEEVSNDKTYGYQQANPINVGGVKNNSGPLNERRFLNALLGPNGEEIKYVRVGSCCHFKTPNGLMDNTGLLDKYRINWTGSSDTLYIYINMYDEGDLKIPVGLTARKKE